MNSMRQSVTIYWNTNENADKYRRAINAFLSVAAQNCKIINTTECTTVRSYDYDTDQMISIVIKNLMQGYQKLGVISSWSTHENLDKYG